MPMEYNPSGLNSYEETQNSRKPLETVSLLIDLGWLMGLEPTTPGITIQYSTFELQPPSETSAKC